MVFVSVLLQQVEKLLDWYAKNRVSELKDSVQVSLGPAAVKAYVVGLRLEAANPKFNTLVVRSSPPVEVVFEDQEVAIPIACDLHSWMKAYVAVIDHDFSSITDDEGGYTIAGLPPGKLVFEAWHEEYGKQTLELELEAGQTVEVDWTFLGTKRKAGRVLPLTTDK